MGIMQPYFPAEMAVKLAKIVKADTFIETGTYMGGTTKWASDQFKNVHTIELSEVLYNNVKDELLAKGNITPHLGDSRNILPKILKTINGNILFWLDGHYSSEITAGKEDPCPLLKELEIILSRDTEDIILIDDARCLGDTEGWPTIIELYKKIKTSTVKNKYMLVCDDNIYIVPDKNIHKELLLNYILERNVILWKQDYDLRNPPKKQTRMNIIKLLKIIGLYRFVRIIYRSIKKKK